MRNRLNRWLNRLPWDSRTRRALDQTFLDWAQEQHLARTATERVISAARSVVSVGRVLMLGLVDEARRASLSPLAGRVLIILSALMVCDGVRAALGLRGPGGFFMPDVVMFRDNILVASRRLWPIMAGLSVLEGFLRVLPLALFLAVGLSRPQRRLIAANRVSSAASAPPGVAPSRLHDLPSPPLIGLAIVVTGAVLLVAGWLHPMTLAHYHDEVIGVLADARFPHALIDRSVNERTLLQLFLALGDPAMTQPWALLSELSLRGGWILLAPAALMFGVVTRRMKVLRFLVSSAAFLALYVWVILFDHLQSWRLIVLRFMVPVALPVALICVAWVLTRRKGT